MSLTEKGRLAKLGEVKVLESKGGRKDVEATEPVSGRQTAVIRKVIRKYGVKTRLASCFCSSCQISKYEECHINRAYPALVRKFKDGQSAGSGHHGHRGRARRRR